MRHETATAYEVIYEDGTTEVVAGVTSYSVEEEFVHFHGTGSLIKAVYVDRVRSFAPVKNPEVLVEPKHTYTVTLKDGSTKTVKADLYRVATHGHESQVQVYEFFTKLEPGTREELTLPFESVQMVERVVETADVPVQAPASA